MAEGKQLGIHSESVQLVKLKKTKKKKDGTLKTARWQTWRMEFNSQGPCGEGKKNQPL